MRKQKFQLQLTERMLRACHFLPSLSCTMRQTRILQPLMLLMAQFLALPPWKTATMRCGRRWMRLLLQTPQGVHAQVTTRRTSQTRWIILHAWGLLRIEEG